MSRIPGSYERRLLSDQHADEDEEEKLPADLDPRGDGEESRIVTFIPTIPITQQRKPFIPPGAVKERRGNGHEEGEVYNEEGRVDDENLLERAKKLKVPGVPRANYAPSTEALVGTTDPGFFDNHARQSVLQQHCSFFDRDGDGVLWPCDTYVGFRRLGFNIILSSLAVLIIHGAFSYPTMETWLPDLRFPIFLNKIHKTKHGSDTGTYDNEGRFIPQKFEDFFAKYSSLTTELNVSSRGTKEERQERERRQERIDEAGHVKYGLTLEDAVRGCQGQRCIMDPVGWIAELLEWMATYLLLWPHDGIMRKEDCRKVYDGSIFYEIAERREKEQMGATAALGQHRASGAGIWGTADEQLQEMRGRSGNILEQGENVVTEALGSGGQA